MAWAPPTEGIDCLECGQKIRSFLGFPKHLSCRHGLTTKAYYDKYLKKPEEEICSCGEQTAFLNINLGYREFCSHECANGSDDVRDRRKQTTIEKYGVENVFQSPEKRAKSRATIQKRYGVDHQMHVPAVLEKIRATNNERYGTEWQIASEPTRDSAAATNVQRYGHENVFSSPEIRARITGSMQERFGTDWALQAEENKAKARRTMEKRYGAPYAAQVPEIRKKQLASGKAITSVTVNGFTIDCQGRYEERFILAAQTMGLQLQNLKREGVTIPYQDSSGKWRKYFPDFFDQKNNTVIEIKSTWTFDGCGTKPLDRDLNLRKIRAAADSGYSILYVMMDGHGVIWTETSIDRLNERFQVA